MTEAGTFDNVSASDTNTLGTEGREYMNTEVIRERKSVRTYKDQEIPEQTLDKVRNYLQKDTGLFDVPIEFTILNAKNDNVSSPVIIGADTYIRMRKYHSGMRSRSLFYMQRLWGLVRCGWRRRLIAKHLKKLYI